MTVITKWTKTYDHSSMIPRKAVKQLERKDQLTSQEQEGIVTEVGDLFAIIKEFIDEKALLLFQGAKECAVDNLKEREEILLDIQEKAKNGEATIEDVKKMKNALSDDFEINLFGK